MQVVFYSDPGHGWGKVNIATLLAFGLADKISNYSYRKGNFAYLEEDCDFPLFINYCKNHGIELEITEINSGHDDSIIRRYPNYTF